MTKTIFKKVVWLGRATTFLVGLAVVLALSVGLASTALAGTGVGARFDLGKTNTVSAISKLVGSVAGPSLLIDNNSTNTAATALDLQVEAGKAPMKVNSQTKVTNLNADKLDGKDVSQVGVNGREQVESDSVSNSDSPKSVTAPCPSGKVVVGTGADIFGGKSGASPNLLTNIVVDQIQPGTTSVTVEAIEEEPTDANWSVEAIAICAAGP